MEHYNNKFITDRPIITEEVRKAYFDEHGQYATDIVIREWYIQTNSLQDHPDLDLVNGVYEPTETIIVSESEEPLDTLYKESMETPYTRDLNAKGGAVDYYDLPKGATTLQDLIEYRNMNGSIKDVFKSCYRLGQKDGMTDIDDVQKIVYYGLRELGRLRGTKDYLQLANDVIGEQSIKAEK